MKLLKRIRRGEPWCREGGRNTGESDIFAEMSTDADRLEVFAGSRNDEGDSLGDEGALEGAKEIIQMEQEDEVRQKLTFSHRIRTTCPSTFHVESFNQ